MMHTDTIGHYSTKTGHLWPIAHMFIVIVSTG